MGSIFNPDSKFTHYTNKFSDLITLNLWFVLTSLVVIFGFSLASIIRAMIYGKVFSQNEVMDGQTN